MFPPVQPNTYDGPDEACPAGTATAATTARIASTRTPTR